MPASTIPSRVAAAALPGIFSIASRWRAAALAPRSCAVRDRLAPWLLQSARTTMTHVQIINPGTADNLPMVLVHADYRRYLFNCPENLQRNLEENDFELDLIRDVFFTRVNSENHVGLLGIILGSVEASSHALEKEPHKFIAADIKVHGPGNTTHLLAALRHLNIRNRIHLTTAEYPLENHHSDQCLTVYPVVLYAKGCKQRTVGCEEEVGKAETNASVLAQKRRILNEKFIGPPSKPKTRHEAYLRDQQARRVAFAEKTITELSANGCIREDVEVDDVDMEQDEGFECDADTAATNAESFPLETSHELPEVICYICHRPTLPGKFNVEVAEALGVKRSKFTKLTHGKTVRNSHGDEVHPHQVLGPPRAGLCFIILDVPSVDYIPSLVQSSKFKQYHRGGGPGMTPGVVVHLLGRGVLEDATYREWVRKFDDSVQHIFSSPAMCPDRITFRHSAFDQFKLSALDSKIFPVPYYSNKSETALSSYEGLPAKSLLAEPMLRYILEPNPGLDVSDVPEVFDHRSPDSSFVRKLDGLTEYWDAVAAVERAKKKEARSRRGWKAVGQQQLWKDIVVTTLGTGSCTPGVRRNVSGTLVRIPRKGSILLDCGEGTFSQMWRHFGPEGVDGRPSIYECLRDLKIIYISHMHADHYIGVVGLITEWNKLRALDVESGVSSRETSRRLCLISAPSLWAWLRESSEVKYLDLQYVDWISPRSFRWSRNTATAHIGTETEASSAQRDPDRDTKSNAAYRPPAAVGTSTDEAEFSAGTLPGVNADTSSKPRNNESDTNGIGIQSGRCTSDRVEMNWRDRVGNASNDCSIDGRDRPLGGQVRERAQLVPPLIKPYLDAMGICRLVTVAVRHGAHAHGVVLEGHEGWKIVYSGDTRPSDRLVEAGMHCSLLIHEATFDDSHHLEAVERKHSTTGDAIRIARRMRAKTILLTHFSKRYEGLLPVPEEFNNLGVAFDSMSVKIGDIPRLSKLFRPLQVAWEAGTEKEAEERAEQGSEEMGWALEEEGAEETAKERPGCEPAKERAKERAKEDIGWGLEEEPPLDHAYA